MQVVTEQSLSLCSVHPCLCVSLLPLGSHIVMTVAAASSACESGGTTTKSNTGKAPGAHGLGEDRGQDYPLRQQPQTLVVQFKILPTVLWG